MDIDFYCMLQGEECDPSLLIASGRFLVIDHRYRGDLMIKGRLKGQVADWGLICFKSYDGGFDEFVNELYLAKDLIIGNKADWRALHLSLRYEDQCNWEFNAQSLRVISELNLDLSISCYQMERPSSQED